MKIFSYLKSLIEKRRQRIAVIYQLLVDLRCNSQNWECHYPFDLENHKTGSYIWIAYSAWGMHFTFKGERFYDMPILFTLPFSWRKKVYNSALRAAKSREIKKRGLQWRVLSEAEKKAWMQ